MSFLNNIYAKSLVENEKLLKFWEDYLKSLKSLDLKFYADKLTVPVLVPVGSRIYFKGELKHTNEVTISLGADYFAKCSVNQAEVLRQKRIKDAETKLEALKMERDHLQNQISFTTKNLYQNQGHEIIEQYDEKKEEAWKDQHRLNLKNYKEKNRNDASNNNIIDEELWNRLEELELQEELENELQIKQVYDLPYSDLNDSDSDAQDDNTHQKFLSQNGINTEHSTEYNFISQNSINTEHSTKDNLLEQVLKKQFELETKLCELKNMGREGCKTEKELLSRLDEIEEIEELEDDMNRLHDVLHDENVEVSETDNDHKINRSVSFLDEDGGETLELAFNHSEVAASSEPYKEEKGITKPSDIYSAFPNSFNTKTSILKKSKYSTANEDIIEKHSQNLSVSSDSTDKQKIYMTTKCEAIKEIKEKYEHSNITPQSQARPSSIFKKRRLQQKN